MTGIQPTITAPGCWRKAQVSRPVDYSSGTGEAARKRGRVGGRRPVVDDDKRAAILARRKRGESIRTIAAGVKVSVGVVHKTLTDAQQKQQP